MQFQRKEKYQAKCYAMWSLWSQVPKSSPLLLFSLEAPPEPSEHTWASEEKSQNSLLKNLKPAPPHSLAIDGWKIQPSELFTRIMRSRSEPRWGRAKRIHPHPIQNEAILRKAVTKGFMLQGKNHDYYSSSHDHMEDPIFCFLLLWQNAWGDT